MAAKFDISQAGFLVRPATPADARACRMLIPQSLPGEWYVAEEGAGGLVIGAAVLAAAMRPAPLLGPGVALHVIAPCRGHGVGRTLLAELLRAAAKRRAAALYAAQRVENGSPEMVAWQALGFQVCDTVDEHELPLAELISRLSPLVKRMRERGDIPTEASLVPLYAARPAEVLQLHLDHLGGDRNRLYEQIRGQGAGAFHPRYSRVLVMGGGAVGCILAHRKSQTIAEVDANIVVPEFRSGWANAWLKLEASQGAATLGITHFHFTSFEHYADTRAFTGKLGGVTTRKRALMYRPLEKANETVSP